MILILQWEFCLRHFSWNKIRSCNAWKTIYKICLSSFILREHLLVCVKFIDCCFGDRKLFFVFTKAAPFCKCSRYAAHIFHLSSILRRQKVIPLKSGVSPPWAIKLIIAFCVCFGAWRGERLKNFNQSEPDWLRPCEWAKLLPERAHMQIEYVVVCSLLVRASKQNSLCNMQLVHKTHILSAQPLTCIDSTHFIMRCNHSKISAMHEIFVSYR